VLRLSTPGGNVPVGMELVDKLSESPLELVTHNVEKIESMGICVYLMGERRIACPHATFKFHGTELAEGGRCYTLPELRSKLARREARGERDDALAARIKKMTGRDEREVDLLVAKTRLTAEKARRLIETNAILTAQEALSWGIAHEIAEPPVAFALTALGPFGPR
jgi:ATP-dependent protease ClpP protease subunit